MTGHLGNAMGDVIYRINPGHTLLFQEINRLALLLGEYCHQYVGASHFVLARRLHVEYGTLQYALEAQRWLCFTLTLLIRNERRGGVDEILQVGPQLVEVGPAGSQHIRS